MDSDRTSTAGKSVAGTSFDTLGSRIPISTCESFPPVPPRNSVRRKTCRPVIESYYRHPIAGHDITSTASVMYSKTCRTTGSTKPARRPSTAPSAAKPVPLSPKAAPPSPERAVVGADGDFAASRKVVVELHQDPVVPEQEQRSPADEIHAVSPAPAVSDAAEIVVAPDSAKAGDGKESGRHLIVPGEQISRPQTPAPVSTPPSVHSASSLPKKLSLALLRPKTPSSFRKFSFTLLLRGKKSNVDLSTPSGPEAPKAPAKGASRSRPAACGAGVGYGDMYNIATDLVSMQNTSPGRSGCDFSAHDRTQPNIPPRDASSRLGKNKPSTPVKAKSAPAPKSKLPMQTMFPKQPATSKKTTTPKQPAAPKQAAVPKQSDAAKQPATTKQPVSPKRSYIPIRPPRATPAAPSPVAPSPITRKSLSAATLSRRKSANSLTRSFADERPDTRTARRRSVDLRLFDRGGKKSAKDPGELCADPTADVGKPKAIPAVPEVPVKVARPSSVNALRPTGEKAARGSSKGVSTKGDATLPDKPTKVVKGQAATVEPAPAVAFKAKDEGLCNAVEAKTEEPCEPVEDWISWSQGIAGLPTSTVVVVGRTSSEAMEAKPTEAVANAVAVTKPRDEAATATASAAVPRAPSQNKVKVEPRRSEQNVTLETSFSGPGKAARERDRCSSPDSTRVFFLCSSPFEDVLHEAPVPAAASTSVAGAQAETDPSTTSQNSPLLQPLQPPASARYSFHQPEPIRYSAADLDEADTAVLHNLDWSIHCISSIAA
ncbi:hypothetical protein ACQY0O_004018 [Thecaphora frezii]